MRHPGVVDQDPDLDFGLSNPLRVGGKVLGGGAGEVDRDHGGLHEGGFGGCDDDCDPTIDQPSLPRSAVDRGREEI